MVGEDGLTSAATIACVTPSATETTGGGVGAGVAGAEGADGALRLPPPPQAAASRATATGRTRLSHGGRETRGGSSIGAPLVRDSILRRGRAGAPGLPRRKSASTDGHRPRPAVTLGRGALP